MTLTGDRSVVGPGHVGYGADGPQARAGGECVVSVAGETLREALMSVAARAGWSPRLVATHPRADSGAVSVSDSLVAVVGGQAARRSVLVVDPTPIGSSVGVRAFASGTVAAVISSDRPSDLAGALQSVAEGWGAVPLDVVGRASLLPELSERQVLIIQAVVAGQATKEIARGLYLSDASIKRELASMFRGFGVENRLALAAEVVPPGVEVEGWWSPSGRCRSGIVRSHLTYT